MIKKRIKALKDFSICTKLDAAVFGNGDVKTVKFSSIDEFNGHLLGGMFAETTEPEGLADIPITFPDLPEDIQLMPEIFVPNGNVNMDSAVSNIPEIPNADVIPSEIQKTTYIGDGTAVVENTMEEIEPPIQTLEEIIVIENAKGKPYKCMNPGCNRLRKKKEPYCDVCLDELEQEQDKNIESK